MSDSYTEKWSHITGNEIISDFVLDREHNDAVRLLEEHDSEDSDVQNCWELRHRTDRIRNDLWLLFLTIKMPYSPNEWIRQRINNLSTQEHWVIKLYGLASLENISITPSSYIFYL